MIVFRCPNPDCAKPFKVQDRYAGKKARCQACGTGFRVPTLREKRDDKTPAFKPVPKTEKLTITPASLGMEETPRTEKIEIKINDPDPETPPIPETGQESEDLTKKTEPASPDGRPKKLRGHLGRLAADEAAILTYLKDFPMVAVKETEGDPPHLYRIEYHIRGLAPGKDGQPVFRDRHLMEIQLPRHYPREKPFCKMLTPIFHPNIDPTYICYTDHWAPQERLLDVIIRIGEMIAYQSWNIKSPRDGEAAMWADLNRNRFPLDRRDLHPGE